MDLAHQIRETIGGLYKVLPTAIVAAAMRPSTTRRDLEVARRRADRGAAPRATRTSRSRTAARRSRPARAMLAERNIIHLERGGRYRVRERTVLRYYARTIQHLLAPPRPQRTH